MTEKIIIANWKANKNLSEAIFWVDGVGQNLLRLEKKIILCPPAVFVSALKEKVEESRFSQVLKLGVQDVSRFPGGAYTGEIAVSQLVGIVEFAIVGHSERRKYFGERELDVLRKVELLLKTQITPILCLGNLKQLDIYLEKGREIYENSEKIIFVYEPPEAISGGGEYKPDTPESANYCARRICQKLSKSVPVLYGGSINPDNVVSFFSQEYISGGLVGQASLDPQTFIQILQSLK